MIKKIYNKALGLFQKFYIPLIIIIGILMFFMFFKILNVEQFIDAIELKLHDFRTKKYTQYIAPPSDPDIVLLLHDNDSANIINKFDSIGLSKWPFPRNVWGEVLTYFRRSSNHFTAFDITFSVTDQNKQNDLDFQKQIVKSDTFSLRQNIALAHYLTRRFKSILNKENQNLIASKKQPYSITNKKEYYNYANKKIELLMSQKDNKAIIENYINKMPLLSDSDFEILSLDLLENITDFVPDGIHLSYLKIIQNTGVINLENTTEIDDVKRDNKPLYRFGSTNFFFQSLPLSTVRNILLNEDKINLSYTKDLLGYTLILGKRRFAINHHGNIFINWHPNINEIGERTASHGAYKTYPLVKAIIYERFYTFDPLTGYKITPEEENMYWQSDVGYFANIIQNPLEDIYFDFLHINFLYSEWILKSDLSKYLDNYDLGYYSYQDHLYDLIRNSDSYDLINYLNKNNKYNKNLIYNHHKKFFIDQIHNNRTYSFKTLNVFDDLIIPIPTYVFNENTNKLNIFSLCTEQEFQVSQLMIYLNNPYYNKILLDKYDSYALSPHLLINKIIVVGECTATGDVHATPLDKSYPGPEMVATALDNYLNDGTANKKLLREAPLWINLLIIMIFVSMTIYVLLKSSRYVSGIISFLALMGTFLAFNILLFATPFIRLSTNMIYPMIFMIFAAICTITYKNMVIDKDKRQIKNLFGKFVSPQILDAVIDDPELLSSQKPRKRNMTVLFSDIRDFTSKSEKSDPDELILQLNEYLTEMVEVIIMKYNGTLDKYMGDAVMAFWGDPIPIDDHARQAVLTGLAMREHLIMLNKKWKQEGKPPLRIGIGINTGEMIVGHMGSPRLIDYTVLGDNVNIASRVEGLNKVYGTDIIITEATYREVKDIVEVESLGFTSVKGRTEEIEIYSVTALKEDVDVNFERSPELFVEKGIKK